MDDSDPDARREGTPRTDPRLAAGGVLLAVLAIAIVVALLPRDEAADRDEPTDHEPPTDSDVLAPPSTPTVTGPATTLAATTVPPGPEPVVSALPPAGLDATHAAATGLGVVLHGGDDETPPVLVDVGPTLLAFVFAGAPDGPTIVHQAVDPTAFAVPFGTVFRTTPAGTEALLVADGPEMIRLFDAAIIGGRPLILYTFRQGFVGPDDTTERLMVLDTDTGERTDLGEVGGWESGPFDARLDADHITVLHGELVETYLQQRSWDGALEWSVRLGSDTGGSLVGTEPKSLTTEWSAAAGVAYTVTEYSAPTDTLIRFDPTPIAPGPGLALDAGVCQRVEVVTGGYLCNASTDPPFLLGRDGDATPLGWVGDGVVTQARRFP